jgi:hypothetical protein
METKAFRFDFLENLPEAWFNGCFSKPNQVLSSVNIGDGNLSNLRCSLVEIGLINADRIDPECSHSILQTYSAQCSVEITPNIDK